jgi:hypothetical protein
MSITTEDLYKQNYSYEILKTNIYVVSLFDILKSQKLTLEFCVKYILNKEYQLTEEENNITLEHVLFYQPHISKIDIINYRDQIMNKRIIKYRKDSFEDFETYAKKYV